MENKLPCDKEVFEVLGVVRATPFNTTLFKMLLGLLQSDEDACGDINFPEFLDDLIKIVRYLEEPFEKEENEIFKIVEARRILVVVVRSLMGYLRNIRHDLPIELKAILGEISGVVDCLLGYM